MDYHIRGEKGALVVFFKSPVTKRGLLKEGEEAKLIDLLFQMEKEGASLLEIKISLAKAPSLLRLLGSTRRLYADGKKLFFDPFSKLSFFYEIEQTKEGEYSVLGRWKTGTATGPISELSFFLPTLPPVCVRQGTLQFFEEECEGEWIAKVFPQPLLFQGKPFQEFLTFLEEEKPPVVWHCKQVEKEEKSLACLPVLLLTDRTGAFAQLSFDYEGERFSSLDVKKNAKRSLTLEKEWEKDLLETDFIPKITDKAAYYCPLDKVAKSLTFLLEMGWNIEDHQGRKILRQTEQKLSIAEDQKGILIKGQIRYLDHETNLKEVIGSFNRKEHFVVLDSHHVGLIDLGKEVQELSSEEIVTEGVRIKKNRVGVLSALFQDPHVSIAPSLKQTVEREFTSKSPTSLFQGTLLPYQQKGLDWLLFLQNWGVSGLLADEMGLGKTVQVLAFFSHLTKTKPTLVVVPTSLVFNWKREILKFLPEADLLIYSGPTRSLEGIGPGSVILTSYTLIRQDFDRLQSIEYEAIILDEGQMIKNPESQVAQSLYRFKGDLRLVMTGTPVENRWEDLWSLFHFLMPDLLGERKEFNAKMLAATSDHRFLTAVKKKIAPFLLRRLKTTVLADLPEKFSQEVLIEMGESQRTLYDAWVQKNRTGLLKKIASDGVSSHRMEILEAILRLRQLACHPWLVDSSVPPESGKFERLFSDLEEVVEEGHKVLIYSQFTQMLKLIEKEVIQRGYGYVYLDGSTKDREGVVQKFQEDPKTQVFLISLKAGGVGLNLTAADYVFLYDPWWNEAAENQAIDRAHRLGRKGSIIARRYITAESIEEKLLKLKKHKTTLASSLLDLEEVAFSELTLQDLTALLG